MFQAIKHKLQIKSMRRGNEEGFPLEEDKARILFGTRHMVRINIHLVIQLLFNTTLL